MTIVGVGIDLIETERIEAALERHGARFLRRVFTDEEQAVCARRRQRTLCLAARFAAKEAVMKALGCGWGPVGWRDIEIERDVSGKPRVRLEGAAARVAKETGVDTIHISLTHIEATAAAYAVAWGGGQAESGPGGGPCES